MTDQQVHNCWRGISALLWQWRVFAAGKFNLRKWVSINTELLSKIVRNREERNDSWPEICWERWQVFMPRRLWGFLKKSIQLCYTRSWEWTGIFSEEHICFETWSGCGVWKRIIANQAKCVTVAAKLFDPMGLISPVMVVLRLLLQELCANNHAWDNPISDFSKKLVRKWMNGFEHVQHI